MLSQLYFWKPLMEKHKKELALVEDYYNRTKSYFENIETEAENYSDSLYNKFLESEYREDIEPADIAEWATDKGIEMYETLAIMKANHLFMTISMLYHIWEQQLRKFTIGELKHYFKFDKKALEYKDIQKIFEIHELKITDTKSWGKIKELKLLVNTIKHGDGDSADNLRKLRPDFFKHEKIDTDLLVLYDSVLLDGNSLQIKESDLYDYVKATQDFWDEMPERAYAEIDKVINEL